MESETTKAKSLGSLLKDTEGFTAADFMLIYGSEVKASAWNAGDPGSIPGLGRSPEEGNENPLWYPYLGNTMDTGAWWVAVRGLANSRT